MRVCSFLSQRIKRSLQKDYSFATPSPLEDCRNLEEFRSIQLTLASLESPDISINFSTYASLLRFCRKAEALHEGQCVHRHIIKNGLHHDLHLVSLLVLMYTDCGAIDEAHNVFINSITRDEFVFTVILRAYARLDSPFLAFQTFEQMLQEGFLPNKGGYISIFTTCAKQFAVLQGKRMHACILATLLVSDIATNTALVTMYNRCRNTEYAKWIFENMGEVDAVIWNVMIASCLEQSQGEYALELFNSMKQQGVILSKVTVIHVLDACGSQMALARGLQLHSIMMGSEFEADLMVQTALINMYGNCGSVRYAEMVFERAESKDEVIWSAMVAVYSQSGQVHNAVQMFDKMLQEGMVSNKFVVSSILSGCAELRVPIEGKRMHARMSASGFTLDGAIRNALISFYGKTSSLKDAWKAFHMTLEPDMVSWNAIIAVCAEHGRLDSACQVFSQLLQQAMLVDKAGFISVLSACANQAALSEGKRMHAWVTCSGFDGDLNLDNALANMHGKCGQLHHMCNIFDCMSEKNLVTWNTLIGVYAQHGRDKEALQLFEEMQETGIAPDRLTFTSVLSACATQGALAEGKRIHEIFRSRGYEPDQIVGSSLVSLYGKCGSLTEAKEVFKSVPEQDVVIWNALITAFSQNGYGEQVLELFNTMQKSNIKPTGVTFISVLSACSHVGRIDEAWHNFLTMQVCYEIEPVVDHYNCMIDLLSRAGRLGDAEYLLDIMLSEPTVASLMTLLGACRKELDDVRGERIAEKVFILDPKSPSPYVMLSNIYASVGRMDDALGLMKLMRDRDILFEPGDSMSSLFDEETNAELYEVYSEANVCLI